MLMVIFGAGASYDSAADFPLPHRFDGDTGGPWRPPLGQDLFRNRNLAFGHILRKYPKLHHILPLLRDPWVGRSVEEELEFLKTRQARSVFANSRRSSAGKHRASSEHRLPP